SALGEFIERLNCNFFYGPTGFGKSVSAAWVANRRRAYYVQAKSVWTRKHTLKSILGEMGIKPGATLPEMADQIAEELAASGRPLIIALWNSRV
ncbi:hypothetical protein AAIH38_36195, partial [Pseudomonas aeruginosa]